VNGFFKNVGKHENCSLLMPVCAVMRGTRFVPIKQHS